MQPTDLIADAAVLSPLVKRLLALARDDDRRVVELCDAVLRQDWDAATTAAKDFIPQIGNVTEARAAFDAGPFFRQHAELRVGRA